MEDPDQLETPGIDPVQRMQLLDRIHPEFHGAGGCIPYRQDRLDNSSRSCQQAASFVRQAGLHV